MRKAIVNIVKFGPSPVRWICAIIGAIAIAMFIFVFPKEGWTGNTLFMSLIALINIIEFFKYDTPSWNLQEPNQTQANLYKIDGIYVAAGTDEEAQLWAMLTNIDEKIEPERIGKVYHFEK